VATVDASARVVDDADANACAYAKAACKEALAGKEGAETELLLRVLEGATNKESADTEAPTFSLLLAVSLEEEGGNRNDTDMEPNDFGRMKGEGAVGSEEGARTELKPLSKEKRPALLSSHISKEWGFGKLTTKGSGS